MSDNKPAFNELANDPIEVTLGGKQYKARRISLDVVFGKAEAAVISRQMERIHQMADSLTPEERTAFLSRAMLESLPTGDKLGQMTADYLKSIDGVRLLLVGALQKDQPDIEQQLDIASLMLTDKERVKSLIEFLTGTEKAVKRPLA